jgi:ribosomal protein S18 acetylase RimI-like enzyme
MSNQDVIIRDLRLEDIPEAMEFVLAEGWNQTPEDWKIFLEGPQNVCKAAEIDGKLIGTVASMNYSGRKVWVSMVLVHKDHRGKGISRMLLDTALKELSLCSSIKLDATDAGLAGYRKFGFVEEYKIVELIHNSFSGTFSNSKNSSLIVEEDFPDVVAFDNTAFGADRSGFIGYLRSHYPDKSRIIREENQTKGYSLGREGNKYHRIGPVSSLTSAYARQLIEDCLRTLQDKSVVIDVLEEKTDLIEWLLSLGFTIKRQFTRMYQFENPYPGRRDLLQVIAGPEFG